MTDLERRGTRAPRAGGAARAFRTAAILSAVVIVAGCGGQDGDQTGGRPGGDRAQGRATTSGVPIVEPPPGSESDGLANLPVAASTSSLLVPGYRYDSDDGNVRDRSLLLLDLADGEVIDIWNHAEYGAAAFTTDGDAVWAAGDRSLGIREASSGATSTIQIPDDIAGTLGGIGDVLEAVGELISVTVDAADPTTSQTLLFRADGSLHCAGPKGTALAVHGELLWSEDARTRLDPTSCTLGPGLDVPLDRDVEGFRVDGAGAYATLTRLDSSESPTHEAPVGSVHRFDVVTGEQTAVSPSIPAEVPDMTVQSGQVWVLTDHQVHRLDAATLDVNAVTPLPAEVVECDGWPRLVPQADRVYLLDDCTAVLYLLEPESGAAISG